MARKKETVTKSESEVTESTTDVSDIKVKRDTLIANLKPHLLSKSVIKRGGPNTRSMYEREKGYEANIQEINELGRQIGEADVSLGSLRDD